MIEPTLIDIINNVGFPIFACIYLGSTNKKVLDVLDKKLDLITLKLEHMEDKVNG